jgi:hypothetical protein
MENRKRIIPEGEPIEGSGISKCLVRIIIPVIIGIIIVSVIAISSVRIVDAGYRGILVQFGNVDTSHFYLIVKEFQTTITRNIAGSRVYMISGSCL